MCSVLTNIKTVNCRALDFSDRFVLYITVNSFPRPPRCRFRGVLIARVLECSRQLTVDKFPTKLYLRQFGLLENTQCL